MTKRLSALTALPAQTYNAITRGDCVALLKEFPMRRAWLLWIAAVFLILPVNAQTRSRPAPLKVGEHIPGFHAIDQFGKERRFGDLTGPKGLVIFFFKSADW